MSNHFKGSGNAKSMLESMSKT